jgi:hypothetical protein
MEQNEKISFDMNKEDVNVAILHAAIKILSETRVLLQLSSEILAAHGKQSLEQIANRVSAELSENETEILKDLYAALGSLPSDLPPNVTGSVGG